MLVWISFVASFAEMKRVGTHQVAAGSWRVDAWSLLWCMPGVTNHLQQKSWCQITVNVFLPQSSQRIICHIYIYVRWRSDFIKEYLNDFLYCISKHKVIDNLPLTVDGINIKQHNSANFLGMIIDSLFNWQKHMKIVTNKSAKFSLCHLQSQETFAS